MTGPGKSALNLVSSKRIRRRRYPNRLAHFGAAAIASLVLGLLSGLAWNYETAIRRHADWVSKSRPSAFEQTSKRGATLRLRAETMKDVIKDVVSPSIGPQPPRIQIVNFSEVADEMEDSGTKVAKCLSQGVELRQRDLPLGNKDAIKLAPACISWSASDSKITRFDQLPSAEQKMLQRFQSYINSLGDYLPAVGGFHDDHPERSLAKAFGLDAEFGNKDSFDILTLLVCSERGTVTVYRGTKEIDPSKWIATQREWYKLAFNPDPSMLPNDITQVFQDVRSLTPILVRT
jgi:hypothetical protein